MFKRCVYIKVKVISTLYLYICIKGNMDNYYTELRNHHAVCKKKTWDNELRLQKNRKPNDNASVKQ